MTEGMVAAPHLMHPTKPSDFIYVEKTPEQCYHDRCNSQRVWEDVWWDKHSSGGLDDQQLEAQECLKEAI